MKFVSDFFMNRAKLAVNRRIFIIVDKIRRFLFHVKHLRHSIEKCKECNANVGNRAYIGRMGEHIAGRHLVSIGHKILDRNYRKRWGEIDIVSQMGDQIHFVEVKTVSLADGQGPTQTRWGGSYDPAEKVDRGKVGRLNKAIESYLVEKFYHNEPPWQLDVITVGLDHGDKKAYVRYIMDIDISRRY